VSVMASCGVQVVDGIVMASCGVQGCEHVNREHKRHGAARMLMHEAARMQECKDALKRNVLHVMALGAAAL